MNTHLPFISLVLIGLVLYSCQPKTQESKVESHLGEIHFKVTGAAEAQPYFEKGLLLLHSFEYEDARAEFLKAQELDPDFAMAFWGEAMTHNQPIWQRQQYDEGKAALEKLAATPEGRQAKAGAELERDLLKAVEVLFGEGDKFGRDKAYASNMEGLYEKYPGNHEVAAFYALSLLGSVAVGRDEAVFEKGAAIAEGILKENPNHPGALHYLIHSYDDPGHASLAKTAADRYAGVAPDAAHALHMPSHIFVAMGMWDEVVASNEASYAASVKRMERMGLDNDARSYHALHWLLYGYLQQGRVADARRILDDMVQYTETLPSKSARSYLVRMKGNYLVETDEYAGSYADIEVNLEELNISQQAIWQFLEGMKAYQQKDKKQLAGIIDAMGQARQQAGMAVTNAGTPMCGAGGSYGNPNQLDIDQAYILELELQGLLASLSGNEAQAEKLFQQAVQLEDGASYTYGPPEVVKPSYELYAEWLLEQNRYEDAMTMFDRALKRGPKRLRALNGQLQASRALSSIRLD